MLLRQHNVLNPSTPTPKSASGWLPALVTKFQPQANAYAMAVVFVNLWLNAKVHLKQCTRLVTTEIAAIYLLWPSEFTPHFTMTATSCLCLMKTQMCTFPHSQSIKWWTGANQRVAATTLSSWMVKALKWLGSSQKGGLPLFWQPALETPWPECSLVLGLNVTVLHCLY